MNPAHTAASTAPASELPRLREFLGCHYHQDVWAIHKSHEAVLDDFLSQASPDAVRQLIAEARILGSRDTVSIRKFLAAHSDGLGFRKSQEYRTWLNRFLERLNAHGSSNTSFERTRGR